MPDYAPPQEPLEVLHLDASLLAVAKPAGLLSVPGKDPAHSDCVLSRLQRQHPEALLVHRLDMDTSGVMVFARTPTAQRHLGLQFERRHTRKHYRAEIEGHPTQSSGQIDLPLIADWPNRPLQKICQTTGKPALTRWSVAEKRSETTLVELFPETGRSHQLRVHCMAIGHPIVGDRFYGSRPAPRLMLHAVQLALRHPEGGAPLTITAPLPEGLQVAERSESSEGSSLPLIS
jgi:tRNA pseudouridine32 synthase/23S rRNA pseudouridine746 synthase